MRQLARDGVPFAFEDVGRGAPPVLLVHDLGDDHTSFAQQIEHFRHSHRVVAVDLRGHGRSGGPEGGHTIAESAADLAWLCYELGVYLPAVVGHGVGGAIAIELATRYPNLPAAVVALDAPAGSPTGPDAASDPSEASCHVPVLYVDAGSEAAYLGHLQERCPRLTVSRFEEAGHLLHLEWPDQINALIDSFLASPEREWWLARHISQQ